MPAPEPIARPPAVRWREFRQGAMTYAVFAVVCLGAVVLWRERTPHTLLVGHAESVHTPVATVRAGTVAALRVDLLDRVKQGDVLAEIAPADLAAVRAQLTAGIELLRAQLLQSTERNVVNYQQLRLDWLRSNVELATARIELQLAETELGRYSALRQGAIISDADFQSRQSRRDTFRDKVAALALLASDLERQLSILQATQKSDDSPVDRAINAATVAQREELAVITESATLRAPHDGIVVALLKRPGESAAAGAAILTLGALRPARIVAYQRQPFEAAFKAGDPIDVTTRGAPLTSARALILRVGTQLEPISATLLPFAAGAAQTVEYGRPLLIEIPSALTLAPAEVVTLSIP